MNRDVDSIRMERASGLVLVLALHAAALWGLWQHRLIPSPAAATTLFVNFIAAPAPEKKEESRRPPPPKPKPIEKLRARQILARAPVVTPKDVVAPPPPPEPDPALVIESPPMPVPVGPVALTSELAVACPERSPPSYPSSSRRLGEEGTVVLRVELDESGRVAAARINSSSGHARLDEAALGAVWTWRCSPAIRDGQPVRAVALQPFKFVLQGN